VGSLCVLREMALRLGVRFPFGARGNAESVSREAAKTAKVRGFSRRAAEILKVR